MSGDSAVTIVEADRQNQATGYFPKQRQHYLTAAAGS